MLLRTISRTLEGKHYEPHIDKDREKLYISTRMYFMISIGLTADEINFGNKLWQLLDKVVVQIHKYSREHTVAHKVKRLGGRRNDPKEKPQVDDFQADQPQADSPVEPQAGVTSAEATKSDVLQADNPKADVRPVEEPIIEPIVNRPSGKYTDDKPQTKRKVNGTLYEHPAYDPQATDDILVEELIVDKPSGKYKERKCNKKRKIDVTLVSEKISPYIPYSILAEYSLQQISNLKDTLENEQEE